VTGEERALLRRVSAVKTAVARDAAWPCMNMPFRRLVYDRRPLHAHTPMHECLVACETDCATEVCVVCVVCVYEAQPL